MTLRSEFATRDGIDIHYLDSLPESDPSLMPLLLCPGLSETAEEYQDMIEHLSPRRTIALSFRGRGQSGTPEYGYDLKDHIADIEAVVEHAGLQQFYLYGYSRGVSYALEYTKRHPERVARLIVLDYPPEHKAMPLDWVTAYIDDYLVPTNRLNHLIRPAAVVGIQRDSTQQQISFLFDRPVLVMRGLLDESLMSDQDVEAYCKHFPNARVVGFANSGHTVRQSERIAFYQAISEFMQN